jgi:D-sedoheptulose 7-phosphate isomerase
MTPGAESAIRTACQAHIDLAARVAAEQAPMIARIADAMRECLRSGRTIFWCGNGGSAADSQHLAAELVGRFRSERRALCSIALTTDTSVLTAVGNDYGYDEVFSRQVEGLVRRDDLVFGLSTSGSSRNVLRAIQKAKALDARTVGLLGRDGGPLRSMCELSIVIPADDTARIQEMHIMIGHILCDLVEQDLFSNSGH